MTDARASVAERFRALNGDHPMTEADDTYVTEHFAVLEDLCRQRGADPDAARERILAGELPMPSYLRSDGAEMVHPDYFTLPDEHGDGLRAWFESAADDADDLWQGYLSGRYVCLWTVNPDTMHRKTRLVTEIGAMLAAPRPDRREWLHTLHARVDELDALEPPFAPYDRLRFGGPVSRDSHIDDARAAHPAGGR